MPAGPVKSVHGAFSIPSLDGIRCVAVLTVFLGHSQFGVALPYWPGFVGVTIFFFLSGYLITTLLRKEHQGTGRVSLGRFYLRRALRILPPAWLAITVAVIVGAIGWVAADTTVWGVLAETLNYTNYYIVFQGRDGLPPDTTQFWSLAVEEHYYLVIPIALLLLWKTRASLRTIGWTMFGIALLVPLWRIYLGMTGASFDRLYTSTDTRFDALLLGTALALLANPALGDPIPRWISKRLGLVASAGVVIFIACAATPILTFRLSIADTIECLALVPIFWFITTRPDGVAGRLLNSRVMVHLGVLSFSIYLFHRLALSLGENLFGQSILADLAGLVLTIATAEVVYRLVEKPCARLRRRLEAAARDRASVRDRVDRGSG